MNKTISSEEKIYRENHGINPKEIIKAISRDEATKKNLGRYYSGKLCVNGHFGMRYTKSNRCCCCKDEMEKLQRKKTMKAITKRTWEWQKRNPEKRIAHNKVHSAIKYGVLKKLPCEVCGNLKVNAHHDDYSKPLEVRWLCVPHHRDLHNNRLELETT